MRRPRLISIISAIFFRLPLPFLSSFLLLTVVWTFLLFKRLSNHLTIYIEPLVSIPILSEIDDVLTAVLFIAVYVVGILIAYNISVVANALWTHYRKKLSPPLRGRPYQPPNCEQPNELFKDIQKIGIVLAGGGAKGAFQAGAMKAIYQFLAENNALEKVKVIAGTSIGSWNALFWLADLVASENGWGERSVHEDWWRSIRLKSLFVPCWFVPGLRNAFFLTSPWQRAFDDIFCQAEVKKKIIESKIHFYFTRSHVSSGKVECTTNNVDAPSLPKIKFHRLVCDQENIDSPKNEQFLKNIKLGVFASMDMPPLFPYAEINDDYYEDGGVIDNLPIMFAGLENCDFIFVLPLTSDFHAEPNRWSLMNRFLRVMDVRQGALERNSLKFAYLYNELAVLRDHVRAIEAKNSGQADEAAKAQQPQNSLMLTNALKRRHKHSRIFAICPLRTFVERTIDTVEFWKSRKAGIAFDTMYQTTIGLLNVKFDPSYEKIQVALVSKDGDVTWDEDF